MFMLKLNQTTSLCFKTASKMLFVVIQALKDLKAVLNSSLKTSSGNNVI